MGFGKQRTGVIIREKQSLALSTLANVTVLATTALALEDDFRILKSEILAHIGGLTAAEGNGLIFGMCNGELSVTEIKAALETNGPLDRNDRGNQETAERKVDILSQPAGDEGPIGVDIVYKGENGGPLIISKKRWTYSNPEGWKFFVYNNEAALQTGATLVVMATHYGVWVT